MELLLRLIIELIAALFHSAPEQPDDEAEPRRPAPVPPRPNRPPQEPAAMSDVNDYLRRMQAPQPPWQQSPPQQPPWQQPQGWQQPQPPAPPPRYAPPSLRGGMPAEVVDVEIVDEPPRGQRVAAHVARHLDTRDISQHADSLAADVARADDVMDARLQSKFDHAVGHLRGGTQDYTVAASGTDPRADAVRAKGLPLAEQVAAMLRDPQSVQTAIVLNEIMRPREW